MVPNIVNSVTLYCDNNWSISQDKKKQGLINYLKIYLDSHKNKRYKIKCVTTEESFTDPLTELFF